MWALAVGEEPGESHHLLVGWLVWEEDKDKGRTLSWCHCLTRSSEQHPSGGDECNSWKMLWGVFSMKIISIPLCQTHRRKPTQGKRSRSKPRPRIWNHGAINQRLCFKFKLTLSCAAYIRHPSVLQLSLVDQRYEPVLLSPFMDWSQEFITLLCRCSRSRYIWEMSHFV